MLIEAITEEEFAEVLALYRKGWTECTETEKKRWGQLVAKARIYQARRAVESAIETTKFIKEQR